MAAKKKRSGGRRGGYRRKKTGGGMRFSAIGLGRKISKMTAVIDAGVEAADNIASGDFAGGAVEFFGTLSADLSGWNPITKSWEPARLAVGYGPALVVEGVNTGIHFIKGLARSFVGRRGSAPAV